MSQTKTRTWQARVPDMQPIQSFDHEPVGENTKALLCLKGKGTCHKHPLLTHTQEGRRKAQICFNSFYSTLLAPQTMPRLQDRTSGPWKENACQVYRRKKHVKEYTLLLFADLLEEAPNYSKSVWSYFTFLPLAWPNLGRKMQMFIISGVDVVTCGKNGFQKRWKLLFVLDCGVFLDGTTQNVSSNISLIVNIPVKSVISSTFNSLEFFVLERMDPAINGRRILSPYWLDETIPVNVTPPPPVAPVVANLESWM